ncbi:MAG: bifunctional aspartate kinase/homoserine dehydrogenase I [Acidobacteria bacterium]|nr:bifunctional aspartate kinase/homoserine dehydrogenase I [Acidobacteriota bacterium]
MKSSDLIILKFGGSSMGNIDGIRRVVRIITGQADLCRVGVVVSAMAGVTDRLLRMGNLALTGNEEAVSLELEEMRRQHLDAFLPLATSDLSKGLMASEVEVASREVKRLTHGIHLLGEFSQATSDKLLSYGEILSSQLLAHVLGERNRRFCHADAREIIIIDRTREGPVVDFKETETRACQKLLPLLRRRRFPVVGGFICRTRDGQPATLGRNGSDYSASIIGAALRAHEIWIYTDVDGIMTADPDLVAEARVLPRISYQEAAEMSYFGAKVVHPKTMIPAVVRSIPIRIRNTFNPRARGTLISVRCGRLPFIKTVTSVRNLALLNIEGNGMIGIPGVASRVFDALARESINVMMISQSSSEHSICLVVQAADAEKARTALSTAFELEIERNLIERILLTRRVAIVSIIGAGMRGRPGISGKFFDALGRSRINVLAIAQGSSELNISAAIAESDYRHAVQAVHTAFGLTRDFNIFMFGCGHIARALLGQISSSRKRIVRNIHVTPKVLGVCNSKSWLFSNGGLPDSVLRALGDGARLQDQPGAADRPSTEAILDRISAAFKSDVVLVDATAADFSDVHLEGFRRGFHIVTANKKPLADSLAWYQRIQSMRHRAGLNYQYEATFGAGLPLLSTLQDLIHTGDRILRIQGCLSGTLGFICSRLDERIPLSAAVREAAALGYTEPDPRDDLGGVDVARKALIIAREIGLPLEMREIALEPMIPRSYFGGGSVEDFMEKLPRLDRAFSSRIRKAHHQGQVLRFLAEIDHGGCRVGPRLVRRDSPIGRLAGPDNILVFQTERYFANPLVIQGPGAGAEVTAAGVLSDILKIARWI